MKKLSSIRKDNKVLVAAILYKVVGVPQRSCASFVHGPEGTEGVSYGNT